MNQTNPENDNSINKHMRDPLFRGWAQVIAIVVATGTIVSSVYLIVDGIKAGITLNATNILLLQSKLKSEDEKILVQIEAIKEDAEEDVSELLSRVRGNEKDLADLKSVTVGKSPQGFHMGHAYELSRKLCDGIKKYHPEYPCVDPYELTTHKAAAQSWESRNRYKDH